MAFMVNQPGLMRRWLSPLSPLIVCVLLSACSTGATPAGNTPTSPQPEKAESLVAQTPAAIANFQTQQQTAGFSADGRHYLHLESWRDKGAGIPHAAVQVRNVAANTCVAQGCIQTRFQETDTELSLKAAETNLLQQTQTLRQDLKLTNPTPGIKLPIVSRSRNDDGSEIVKVQLRANQPLQLRLKQKQAAKTVGGTAEMEQAAMQLDVSYGENQRSLGSLDQMHEWTTGFSIREVQQSPDGKSVVVLIVAAKRTFEGTLGRTLVQSFDL